MNTWFGTLLSECKRVICVRRGSRYRQACPRVKNDTGNDSLKRLHELRLRQLSKAGILSPNAQAQRELVSHWTWQQTTYKAPLPEVSSDSWSRFEDFLASRSADSKSDT